jgi:signal transduction histidine kinase
MRCPFPPSHALWLDASGAVAQMLSNLLDNAAKYTSPAAYAQ